MKFNITAQVSGLVGAQLQPNAYSALPTGAITPLGWMATQLLVQAEGVSLQCITHVVMMSC